ncbi:MAG TPA: hypothetical protein V6C86_20025 [Oculatellaceae cyanobacterium]
MNFKIAFLALSTVLIASAPVLAGQVFDSTTVGADNSLSNGAGTTGPGMSGYEHSGMQDKPMRLSSISDGKTPERRIKRGFSRRAIYNNNADLALPHIR